MEKENTSQLELFSKIKGTGSREAYKQKNFFSIIRNYEKTVLITIGFLITGIISFSLGVEKEKKAATLKTNSYLDIALKTQPSQMNQAPKKPITSQQRYQPAIERQDITKQPMQKQPSTQGYIKSYTIQVATFQVKTLAQKEVEALKKKGFMPLVLSKSGYTVLCVGSFTDKEKATSSLPELKKQYRDCFIRRL